MAPISSIAGTNDVGTLVEHLTGSEAETLRCLAAVDNGRDRDQEFVTRTRSVADALATVDAADQLLE